MARARLQDVAGRAGVSITTVSTLTSVRLDRRATATTALDLDLDLDRVEGATGPGRSVRTAHQLVVRGSSTPASRTKD